MIRLLFGLAVFLWVSNSMAENYCAPMPKAEKEGDTWYIPEGAFTKEGANDALAQIHSLIDDGWKGKDFDAYNPIVRIKGYLYRSYLENYKREFGKDDEIIKDEFCKFIKDEAYVSH